MKNPISIAIFLCITFQAVAQTRWEVAPSVSASMDAAVYVPALDMAAFFSGGTINYVSAAGESSGADVADYGGLPAGWAGITAAVRWDASSIMLFKNNLYALFDTQTATISLRGLFPGIPAVIDAATEFGEDDLLFFSGGEYVIYTKSTQALSESSSVSGLEGFALSEKIDAVMTAPDGYIYFFAGGSYQMLNTETLAFEGGVVSLGGAAAGLPPVVATSAASGPPVVNIPAQAAPTGQVPVVRQARAVSSKPALDTDGWCLTGTPSSGSGGLAEHVTEFGGGDEGSAQEDVLPQGVRVKEIRVWGSYVITGIQTVIQDTDGKVTELPILGEQKGRTQVFEVPEGECITGVKGTYLGDYGPFLNGITFMTTGGQSKLFGNRGRKMYEVKLPTNLSFYGFSVKFNNYISAIALKYVGYEDVVNAAIAQEDNQDSAAATGSFADKYKGEYSDDHEDYMIELQGMQFGAADGQRLDLPAVEWLGLGVDYLTLDPLDIGGSPTKEKPLVLILSRKTGGQEGKKQIPHGTDYKTIGGGSSHDYKNWIESYGDFTSSFGVGVGISVGTPVGGGSMSGSYKQMNNTKTGSSEIFYSQTVERKLFNLNMDLLWRDRNTGEKKRQKLDFDFREKIDNLPVPRVLVSMQASQMRKGRPLHSEIERIKNDYQAIIDEYGTHFIGNADFGGKYVASTKITKQTFESTRMTEMEFKAAINAKIKVVDIGADVEFNLGNKSIVGNKTETLNTNKYVQGGSGETEFETWNTSLKERPVPIEVQLIPTYKLLTPEFWPNDKDIEKKQDVLRMVTEKYQIDNGIEPQRINSQFFTKPKDINYTYTMTVTGIKCIAVHDAKLDGSANVYGTITAGYAGPQNSNRTIWSMAKSSSVDIRKSALEMLNEKFEVTLPGENPSGYFTVTGTLYDSMTNGMAGFGKLIGAAAEGIAGKTAAYGTHSKRINFSEITDVSKDFKVEGFNFESTKLEITMTVIRTPDYAKKAEDTTEGK